MVTGRVVVVVVRESPQGRYDLRKNRNGLSHS